MSAHDQPGSDSRTSIRRRLRNASSLVLFRSSGALLRLAVRGEAAADVPPPRRILVLKLDEIGDVVLASPLLRELRGSFPDAVIELVVRPETAALVDRCPHV